MSSITRVQGIPNIIIIGVPSLKHLERVKTKLRAAGLGHSCWVEPDNDLGFTAIATRPLTIEEKQCLAHYRLWQPISRCSSGRRAPSIREAGGANPPSGSNFHSPVAQLVERPSDLKSAGRLDVRTVPGEPSNAPIAQWQSG